MKHVKSKLPSPRCWVIVAVVLGLELFTNGRAVWVEYIEPEVHADGRPMTTLAHTTVHYGYVLAGTVTHRSYQVAATSPRGGGRVGLTLMLRGPDEPVAVAPERVTVGVTVTATTLDGQESAYSERREVVVP